LKFDNTLSDLNKIIIKKEHALIGVSPCNSYFSISNMEFLFSWARENFHNFNVFIMDGASIFNFMAMGYDEKRALKKTRKNDKNLQNKVITSLTNIGFSLVDARKKILLLSELSKCDKYIEVYNRYVHIFETNAIFREDCLGATKLMLSEKMEDVTDEAIHLSMKYLLAELPLWLETPNVLNIQSSAVIYQVLSFFWGRICYNHSFLSPKQELIIKRFDG